MSAFNPATVDQQVLRFNVDRSAEYEVLLFNETSRTFEPVASDQLCYEATEDTPKAKRFTVCELYVDATVQAQ